MPWRNALELIVDGGVRRGTHVLKALALGADACSIGRPYLYGLAAGGQAGVQRAMELLRDEVCAGHGPAWLPQHRRSHIPERVRGSRFSTAGGGEPGLRRVIAASRN